MTTVVAAVIEAATALGVDIDDAGEHAGLVALCLVLAARIDEGVGVADASTELRRSLNDLRRQTREDGGEQHSAVIEQLRAV